MRSCVETSWLFRAFATRGLEIHQRNAIKSVLSFHLITISEDSCGRKESCKTQMHAATSCPKKRNSYQMRSKHAACGMSKLDAGGKYTKI